SGVQPLLGLGVRRALRRQLLWHAAGELRVPVHQPGQQLLVREPQSLLSGAARRDAALGLGARPRPSWIETDSPGRSVIGNSRAPTWSRGTPRAPSARIPARYPTACSRQTARRDRPA